MKDTYKNVHTHIFTMDNAPEKFLQLFLPKPVANAVDTATNSQLGVLLLSGLIAQFGSQGKRYAQFLKIGKSKDQITVFEELMAQYSDPSIELVALTINMNYMGIGATKSGFEGQLQKVIDIKRRYPERLLLFFGLDPRWQQSGTDIRKEVERYFETKIDSGGRSIYPFTGLKIYPSNGFYAFDERLKETFAWAADNGVPVLSHTNYLGGIFSHDPQAIQQNLNPLNPYTDQVYDVPKFIHKKSRKEWLTGSNLTNNCKRTCSYFLEPHGFESVLNHFNNANNPLKICFAHYGGSEQMLASMNGSSDAEQVHPYGVKDVNWYTQIQYLMTQYPGAYTDISYNVAEGVKANDNVLFNAFFKECNKPYGQKIMYGTDFFLAEKESPEKNTYDAFRTFASDKTLDNGHNFWDQIARENTNAFLKSKYYDL
ncbi:MAG: amidohydrolase family protein [bacterium]|nr:amidohydrolase family protein [bacterium]